MFYDFWPFLYCSFPYCPFPLSLPASQSVSLMLPLWQPRYVYVRSTQGLTHISLSFSLSLLLHLPRPPGCNSKYLTSLGIGASSRSVFISCNIILDYHHKHRSFVLAATQRGKRVYPGCQAPPWCSTLSLGASHHNDLTYICF